MRISRKLSNSILSGLLVFGFGHRCSADSILFTNLATVGNLYDSNHGWNVIGAASSFTSPPGSQFAPAFAFTPTSTAYLTGLDLALGHVAGTNAVTVDLMSDASGPGAVLESWNVSGVPTNGICCPMTALSGNGTLLLESGTTYWVAVLPGDSVAFDSWAYNSTGDTGTVFENMGSAWALYATGPGVTVGAFEVQGSPVPEPDTLGLLGGGLLVLAGLLRRRFCRSAI
jgi:hypothetical protein